MCASSVLERSPPRTLQDRKVRATARRCHPVGGTRLAATRCQDGCMETTTGSSGDQTIGELGEFGLIARVARGPHSERVLVGPGDDCAVVAVGDRSVLVS